MLGSCYSPVVFDEAYPKNEPALDAIPEFVQGIFMCESDSTIVTINDRGVYALNVNYFEESIDKINERETCTLIGNEIYFDEIQDCVPVDYISEDSIKGQFSTIDTLFHLNAENIVKTYKGSVVLSSHVDNKEWIISLLSIDSYNNIFYRAINENSELEELAQITGMEQIGVDRNSEPIYKIKPTKAEFEKIFDREDIFIVCEYLMRVNLEEFPYFVY
ncbi:hypothetical protein GCM10007940_22840 [Portibacter lacus]|uniref:Uncharacterized protein n=1 Tax=Portibacter lacus TaxID=1099794 RepID=A0AA37WFH9_9BACT|nr:hypothetical protein GCM10007940_22840 [Portibacter lacus]